MLFKDAMKALEGIAGVRYWSIEYRENKRVNPKPCWMYMDSPPTIFEGATYEDCLRKIAASEEARINMESKSEPEILNGIEDTKEKENE